MEHNTAELNDPISKKLDDNAMLERLVRQAVSDAADKVRKLGFPDKEIAPVKQADHDQLTCPFHQHGHFSVVDMVMTCP